MRRLFRTVVPFVLASLLFGCPQTPLPEQDPDAGDQGGEVETVDALFVPSESEPGTVEFETNDTAYWGPYGYTLLTLTGNAEPAFAAREVALNKVSGNGAAGYGVVVCCYDTGIAGIGETMLAVMINTHREYIVGEVTGAAFSEIVPWTESELLVAGYNHLNLVKLSYDSAAAEFTLLLNGGEAARFRDEVSPCHDNGGRNGYLVVISPLDSFPGSPVHVIFKEK
jgi:hypothetical protein